MLKKEIINNCNQLRKKYTDKPDENRIIGYNAQKRLYNDFLNGKYKAYAFKLILDDVICPSTNTFIPIHSNFLYKTNTQIMHGYKDYKYKDMIKDIIEVYSKENIYRNQYLIESYQLKECTKIKGKLVFKKLENLNIYFN
jgi:hypothetical protein|tara:strand:+ start:49 stop:468 length:420 start_codon:yes stop_codon:yes gene_type:complete